MTQTVERMLPLYEAKMLDIYDHRNADVVKSETAAKRQNQPRYLTLAEHQDINREAIPLAWVREEVLPKDLPGWLTGFSDVTSATNERTVKAAALPRAGVGHTYPLWFGRDRALVLAVLNSFAFDYVARQKVAGLHLTYTYVMQLPMPSTEAFHAACPWDPGVTTAVWVQHRVVALSVTSQSLIPMSVEILGDAELHGWRPDGRRQLRAELDAAMFHMFGIPRDDVDYIMDTFLIVKRKDEAAFGSYRTKERILEVYDALQAAIDAGAPYRSAADGRHHG